MVQVLVEMVTHLLRFTPIQSLTVNLAHPVLRQALLNIELDLSVLNRLLYLVPPELYSQLVALTSLQNIHHVRHLIRSRLLLVQL